MDLPFADRDQLIRDGINNGGIDYSDHETM